MKFAIVLACGAILAKARRLQRDGTSWCSFGPAYAGVTECGPCDAPSDCRDGQCALRIADRDSGLVCCDHTCEEQTGSTTPRAGRGTSWCPFGPAYAGVTECGPCDEPSDCRDGQCALRIADRDSGLVCCDHTCEEQTGSTTPRARETVTPDCSRGGCDGLRGCDAAGGDSLKATDLYCDPKNNNIDCLWDRNSDQLSACCTEFGRQSVETVDGLQACSESGNCACADPDYQDLLDAYNAANAVTTHDTTSTLTTEAKAECNSTNPQLRNGVCELRYNSMQCGWDAGDCCKISAGNYDPQNCIDPQQTNSCETMPPNENAVDSNSCLGSPANTKCSFACIPGHAVSESDSELICNGATGTWETLSGSIPSIICRTTPCTSPPNANLFDANTCGNAAHNGTCEFACGEGKLSKGSAEYTCDGTTGTWIGDLQCGDNSCKFANDGTCDGEDNCEPNTDCTDCGTCDAGSDATDSTITTEKTFSVSDNNVAPQCMAVLVVVVFVALL